MKRTAEEAFGGGTPSFVPTGVAAFDPKAYFAQWSQQAWQQQAVEQTADVTGEASSRRLELKTKLQAASAVRCAALLKENWKDMTNSLLVDAVETMATKSSFKLREQLFRQPHVQRALERLRKAVGEPMGQSLGFLGRAVWGLVRFPSEALGDDKLKVFGPLARALEAAPASSWTGDEISRILWTLAKAEIIAGYKPLVSQVVAELVRDQGRRIVKELSNEALVNILFAVARARRKFGSSAGAGSHNYAEIGAVTIEGNDDILFAKASSRICDNPEAFDVKLLAETIHVYGEMGIKDEKLFRAICPCLLAKQKDLREDEMAKCIKVYRRFMLPLKEEAQGFRTLAVVVKGDYIRPSDKPRGPRKAPEKPKALYPETPVHHLSA